MINWKEIAEQNGLSPNDFAVEILTKNKLNELKTATLHYKPQSIFKPDFFIETTSDWIVYPWEYFEFSRLIIQKELTINEQIEDIKQKLLKIGIPNLVIDNL